MPEEDRRPERHVDVARHEQRGLHLPCPLELREAKAGGEVWLRQAIDPRASRRDEAAAETGDEPLGGPADRLEREADGRLEVDVAVAVEQVARRNPEPAATSVIDASSAVQATLPVPPPLKRGIASPSAASAAASACLCDASERRAKELHPALGGAVDAPQSGPRRVGEPRDVRLVREEAGERQPRGRARLPDERDDGPHVVERASPDADVGAERPVRDVHVDDDRDRGAGLDRSLREDLEVLVGVDDGAHHGAAPVGIGEALGVRALRARVCDENVCDAAVDEEARLGRAVAHDAADDRPAVRRDPREEVDRPERLRRDAHRLAARARRGEDRLDVPRERVEVDQRDGERLVADRPRVAGEALGGALLRHDGQLRRRLTHRRDGRTVGRNAGVRPAARLCRKQTYSCFGTSVWKMTSCPSSMPSAGRWVTSPVTTPPRRPSSRSQPPGACAATCRCNR